MESDVGVVGGPASAFLSGANGYAEFAGGLPLWSRPRSFLLVMSMLEWRYRPLLGRRPQPILLRFIHYIVLSSPFTITGRHDSRINH